MNFKDKEVNNNIVKNVKVEVLLNQTIPIITNSTQTVKIKNGKTYQEKVKITQTRLIDVQKKSTQK